MSRWLPESIELSLGDTTLSPGCPADDRNTMLTAAFDARLAERQAGRGARVTCVLGGEATRYAVVPWIDELWSPRQRHGLAEQCLREAHGDAVLGWTVREHAHRPGVATLACAVDTDLLDRLFAAARARHLRLISVQPALVHAFNRSRREIAGGLHWFVLQEPRWTTLMLGSPQGPRLVKRLPRADKPLGALLDREWFMLGMEADHCTAYVMREDGSQSPGPAPQAAEAGASRWRLVELGAAA